MASNPPNANRLTFTIKLGGLILSNIINKITRILTPYTKTGTFLPVIFSLIDLLLNSKSFIKADDINKIEHLLLL